MITGKNMIAVAASVIMMSALCCGAYGQDSSTWRGLPNKLGDITQPEATPIPLTPRKHALPITPAEEAEGGVIWGPGHEVQIGLRTRLLVRGERSGRFIFDVYLRNKTDRTLTIKCPGYSGLSVPGGSGDTAETQSDRIYCSPTMQDKHGKLVEIGVRQGTEERRFSLAPGQIIPISHWMLKTAGIQAQSPDMRLQTQTAYVSPGAYLMSCSVKAVWDGQSSELRTGKVPFEVQKADVEDIRVPAHSP